MSVLTLIPDIYDKVDCEECRDDLPNNRFHRICNCTLKYSSHLAHPVIKPIKTINRAVPRIPMSRLLISIDFMRDPLIEVYENPIFTKSRI